ncbi:MAG: hypothetical protein WD845_05555 [Pirellulales bacterium]
MRKMPVQTSLSRRALQAWWLACVTGVALLATSCRSLPRSEPIPQPPSEATLVRRAAAEAVAHDAQKTPHVPLECIENNGIPVPMHCESPWAPPGIAGPWPHDEYLLDGGDRDIQVNVSADKQIHGVEMEDTVAVYETIDGETRIKPSNRVCLYSPRFAAVRQVTGAAQSEQADQPIGVDRPLVPVAHQDDQLATTAVQPEMPEGQIGRKIPNIERVGEGAVPATSRQPIAGLEGGFAPHEDFLVMRLGVIKDAERARLAEAIDAAITWTHDAAVQVVLEEQQAVEFSGDQKAQATFRVQLPNNPCLRIIKTASTKVAKPGDIVDFTIRFDNLGDQTINSVVLIDNLTTRLEYVPGTAECSRPAEFFTTDNQGDSLVLRWELTEPLPVGHGGLVRFHCKVR